MRRLLSREGSRTPVRCAAVPWAMRTSAPYTPADLARPRADAHARYVQRVMPRRGRRRSRYDPPARGVLMLLYDHGHVEKVPARVEISAASRSLIGWGCVWRGSTSSSEILSRVQS